MTYTVAFTSVISNTAIGANLLAAVKGGDRVVKVVSLGTNGTGVTMVGQDLTNFFGEFAPTTGILLQKSSSGMDGVLCVATMQAP